MGDRDRGGATVLHMPGQAPLVTLIIRQGPTPGRNFTLSQNAISLGRLEDNDVAINHEKVSRHHASLTWEQGRLVLRDLNSANGTFLNGRRITAPQEVYDGDVIGLSEVLLDFHSPELQKGVAYPVVPAAPAPVVATPVAAAPTSLFGGSFLGMVAIGVGALVVLALIVAVGFVALRSRGPGKARPTVVIDSPTEGQEVIAGQEVAVQSTAHAPGGVTRLELWADEVLADTTNVPGGSQPDFKAILRWTPSAAGSHVLMVKAYDQDEVASDPTFVVVNVVEAATETPTETSTLTPTETPTETLTPAPTETPTETPTPTPTSTPTWRLQISTPTLTTTPLATPTPAPTPAPVCVSDAAFVQDVAVPDGTVFAPGQRIDKIWRLRNSGNCAWEAGYSLAYQSGDLMGAPASVPVPSVSAGGVFDVAVTFYAPYQPGSYTSYWIMRDSGGQPFGPTVRMVILVQVTPTPVPTPTPIPTWTSAPPYQPPSLPAGEPVINFWVDKQCITRGECTTLRWSVENVREVYLSAPKGSPLKGVIGQGSVQVCPEHNESYVLHVVLNDQGDVIDRWASVLVDYDGPPCR